MITTFISTNVLYDFIDYLDTPMSEVMTDEEYILAALRFIGKNTKIDCRYYHRNIQV